MSEILKAKKIGQGSHNVWVAESSLERIPEAFKAGEEPQALVISQPASGKGPIHVFNVAASKTVADLPSASINGDLQNLQRADINWYATFDDVGDYLLVLRDSGR